jgi:hypothetical protein
MTSYLTVRRLSVLWKRATAVYPKRTHIPQRTTGYPYTATYHRSMQKWLGFLLWIPLTFCWDIERLGETGDAAETETVRCSVSISGSVKGGWNK